jgi:hypothetical protein
MRIDSYTVLVFDRDGRRVRRFEVVGSRSRAFAAAWVAASDYAGATIRVI